MPGYPGPSGDRGPSGPVGPTVRPEEHGSNKVRWSNAGDMHDGLGMLGHSHSPGRGQSCCSACKARFASAAMVKIKFPWRKNIDASDDFKRDLVCCTV